MKTRFLLATTGAIAGLSAIASAQTSTANQPYTFTIRAGGALSIDQNLRDITNGLIGVGLDYTFDKTLFKNSETFLSVDALFKDTHGRNLNIFPIMLNQRFYLSQTPGSTTRTYAYVGLGTTIVDVNPSTATFGGRVGIGAEFAERWVGELAFYASSANRTGNVHGTFLAGWVGFRF